MSSAARSFVVTTSIDGQSKSQVWNPSEPLPIGFPFRWVMERTVDGVRVRNVSSAPDSVQASAVREVSREMIERGEVVELPRVEGDSASDRRMTFQVRPMQALRPAFEPADGDAGGELHAYACVGHWLTQSTPVGRKYVGMADGEPAFSLYRSGGDYRIDFHVPGVILTAGDGGAGREGAVGQALSLSPARLALATVELGSLRWRFGAVRAIEWTDSRPGRDARDPESERFRKASIGVGVALGVLALMTAFWPKPDSEGEALIPAQYTQLVMKPQASGQTQASPTTNPTQAEQAQNAPKKAAQTAVVQAFRAKALQSAVSGLLKGGMTTLLAQSDFVAGRGVSADARRVFDKKSDALRATADATGALGAPPVQVATLGGDGAAGGKSGVGYRKGEHAGVQGQGKSFISMDTGGSDVQEGLTKDEVGEVIHRHLSEVRYCYESAMIRTPDLEGKLVVNFTIGGPGNVKSADVKQSTLPDPRLDDCILRRLMTWKFPNTKGGIDVSVSYPFIFKTLGR